MNVYSIEICLHGYYILPSVPRLAGLRYIYKVLEDNLTLVKIGSANLLLLSILLVFSKFSTSSWYAAQRVGLNPSGLGRVFGSGSGYLCGFPG